MSAKQRRRKRISDTATTLFFERGFDAVSIAEIAEKAGVSKMTVTNHFTLKEDLIFDEFDDELAQVGEALANVSSLGDAIDTIERYCIEREHSGGTARALSAQYFPNAWHSFADMVLASRALTQRFHAHYVDMHTVIRAALPAAIPATDATIAAWMLAATVHLVDWWPFEAVGDGLSDAKIRERRAVVRARAFALLRSGADPTAT